MTKEEKIREAYGIHFNKCSPDENGWSKYQLNENKELISEFAINSVLPCEFNNFRQDNANHIYCIRPVLLQGIENNNGWIKIESEDDLPKIEIDCHFIKDNLMYQGVWDNVLKGFYNGLQKINPTHYQPIQKPQPPIY